MKSRGIELPEASKRQNIESIENPEASKRQHDRKLKNQITR